MSELSADYWNQRYLDNNIGWDLGSVSPAIKLFFDKHNIRDDKILIPGAGNSYEAEHLHRRGFTKVHVIDFSEQAMLNFMSRVPSFPFQNLHLNNFFDHQGSYDIIVEQTFFCALNPKLREKYKLKMFDLLNPGGIILGLLFNISFGKDHPPYGGNEKEYKELFSSHFEILELDICQSSVKPRAGNELFFRLKKKSL